MEPSSQPGSKKSPRAVSALDARFNNNNLAEKAMNIKGGGLQLTVPGVTSKFKTSLTHLKI